jgi:exosortase E/protease (VPEID-CTERM system)
VFSSETAPSMRSSVRALNQWRSPSLLRRLTALTGLIVLELIAASIWLDPAVLVGRSGLARIIFEWGHPAVQWTVAFSALWLTFSWRAHNSGLRALSTDLGEMIPRAYWPLLGHAASLMLFGGLAFLLFRKDPPHFRPELLAGSFLAAGVLATVSAACAFLPLKLWFGLLLETRQAAVYAALGSLGACLFGAASHSLWRPTARLTFGLVEVLLRPFIAGMAANSATLTISSQSFGVEIWPECSGLEGMGLMLIFATAWLWLFRHEYRFPQALLLVPAGVMLIWVLNAVRIAALILIGNAGAPQIAKGGFHSEAGWIAFNIAALCFCLTLRRIPYLTEPEADVVTVKRSTENPTAGYVIPLLAILGAGMISSAAAGGFEWLYPLRLLAAVVALWWFRDAYRGLDWHCGKVAPAIGVITLAIWLGLESMTGKHLNAGMAAGLGALPASGRVAWLVFRTLAAVITVPIAEELAFRGFLIRRLISENFDSLDPRRYTYAAVLISSVAFGLMHGERWVAGTVAGILYAIALLRRGRIGDAIVAHAITNAGLAAWVLLRGDWGLW